jgi:hypothetical protein
MRFTIKNRFLKTALVAFALAIASPSNVVAQCPMCKIGAESNLKNGGTAGNGLNTGILYMLAMPYLLVATLGILWYRNRKKESEISEG